MTTEPVCLRGHAYDEANTRWQQRADGRLNRACKRCDAEKHRRRRSQPKPVGDPNDLDLILRIATRLRFDGDCLIFDGGTPSGMGYRRLSYKGVQRPVHRLVWEIWNGRAVPDGMFVCHSCDVPPCANPAHLWIGTPRDNTVDMHQKGRAPTLRGSAHQNSKLTEQQVVEIRRRYVPRVVTLDDLAAEFGVDRMTIHNVVRFKGWTHVPHHEEDVA